MRGKPVPNLRKSKNRWHRRERGGRCSHTQCSDCRTKRGYNYGRRRIRRSERKIINQEMY